MGRTSEHRPDPLDAILVGDSTELLRVDTLCDVFRLSKKSAIALCISLAVPIIHIGLDAYFNPNALDRAIFLISRLGCSFSRFAAPGSEYKGKKASRNDGCITKLTSDDIQKLWTAAVEQEYRTAARTRGRTTAAVLRKLMAATANDILGAVPDGIPDETIGDWDDGPGAASLAGSEDAGPVGQDAP